MLTLTPNIYAEYKIEIIAEGLNAAGFTTGRLNAIVISINTTIGITKSAHLFDNDL